MITPELHRMASSRICVHWQPQSSSLQESLGGRAAHDVPSRPTSISTLILILTPTTTLTPNSKTTLTLISSQSPPSPYPNPWLTAAGAHAVALLGVKRGDDVRLGFHTHCWPLQIVVWGVLVFVCFLMPNSVFSAYGQVAKARASRLAAAWLAYTAFKCFRTCVNMRRYIL